MPVRHAARLIMLRLLGVGAVFAVVGTVEGGAPGATIEYQKLLADDGQTPDQFGTSVDTYDGRMIIGAKYGDSDIVADSGAVYLWNRVGPTSWDLEAKLTAPDAFVGDVFGISSALGPDVALIGAYYDDITGGNDRAGSVYSFTRALDGTWGFHEKFFAPGAVGGEIFGYSMALDVDVAIIGAPGLSTSGLNGVVHIYRRDLAGDWIHEQTLAPAVAQQADEFAQTVAIEGDTAVVGAWNRDSGLGAVYVFSRDAMTGVWDSGVEITPDAPIAGERFGWSVAISGDTILIGATQAQTGAPGSAYVFRSDGLGGWAQEARLVGAEAIADDQVGNAVEITGDFALVGSLELAPFPFVGDNGSVYVYRRSGVDWTQIDRLRASDGEGNDQFGSVISIHRDLLIVGARAEDALGFSSGASYVFDTHGAFCPADFNDDFVVDTADLGLLISGFGGMDPGLDINGDGVVDTADLGLLISAFGSNCN